jgi:hypothetical protein
VYVPTYVPLRVVHLRFISEEVEEREIFKKKLWELPADVAGGKPSERRLTAVYFMYLSAINYKSPLKIRISPVLKSEYLFY